VSDSLSSPTLSRRRRRRRELAGQRIQILARRGATLGLTLALGLGSYFLLSRGLSTPVAPIFDAQIVPETAVLSQWIPYPELAAGTVLTDLQARMTTLTAQPRLRSGYLFYDPAGGRQAALKADEAFSAASVIKLPVLVEFFRQVDDGRVRLDEVLTLRQDHKGGGSGALQYRPNGTKLSALAVATLMIVRSDNTATNMIVDRLGGPTYVNAQFERWGLQQTALREPLPDLGGRNSTSPRDLILLLDQIERGHLLSPASRLQAYAILERTRVRTLLNPGLAPTARIFHKTGDIGKMVGDAGIILMPDGRRYLAAALVERPHNDRRANQLIARLSQHYYHFMATGSLLPLITPAPPRLPPPAPARKPAALAKSTPRPNSAQR